MICAAPSERTNSALATDVVATTCAPLAMASCTTYTPTPPAPPCTSTRWPGCKPASSTAEQAASAPTGTAAASSKDRGECQGHILLESARAEHAVHPVDRGAQHPD